MAVSLLPRRPVSAGPRTAATAGSGPATVFTRAYARAVALDGDVAFLTTSTGPETADGRLYRARMGEPFAQCSGGLPESFPFNLDTGSVTALGGHVALGTHSGQVYRSADGGSTWEIAAQRMKPVTAVRFS